MTQCTISDEVDTGIMSRLWGCSGDHPGGVARSWRPAGIPCQAKTLISQPTKCSVVLVQGGDGDIVVQARWSTYRPRSAPDS